MPQSTAYSMLNVVATYDGLPVRGLWDGDDAVVVTQNSDVGTPLVGANGDLIFSHSADNSVQVTLRLQHTSPTHKWLLRRWALQKAGRVVAAPFTLLDTGSGEGGVADQCYIMRAPTDSKGMNATVREWILVSGDWLPNVV